MNTLEPLLSDGLSAFGLTSDVEQRQRLLAFLGLLRKWNRVYNLTAIVDPVDMLRLHLLDSLSIAPYLRGETILDVGTGAGLPGIPLAVMRPDLQFTLVDSNAKKTRFAQQAAIELRLRNVTVATSRIETFQASHGFDIILARAYAALADIVAQTARLLNPGGMILASKGRRPDEEIQVLKNVMVETFPLHVPGVDAERHLVAITIP